MKAEKSLKFFAKTSLKEFKLKPNDIKEMYSAQLRNNSKDQVWHNIQDVKQKNYAQIIKEKEFSLHSKKKDLISNTLEAS